MKKSIIKITAAAVFTFISFTVFAQQGDIKPKIDESNKNTEQDKTQLTATAPQIVAPPKAMTVNEQPKPIVPGGEFKPMDTDKAFIPNDKKLPTEIHQPIVTPVSKTVVKRAEVIELNAHDATQQKAKSVPQVLKKQ